MGIFEKPLDELKSFFNLNESLEKSLDGEDKKEDEDEEKKKKEEEKKEEKSLNDLFTKVDGFFKSIEEKVDSSLAGLNKSLEESNAKNVEGFTKLVKSFEEITKAVDQSLTETKEEINKSIEDFKAEVDARIKKLEDTPKAKKSLDAIERFKNQEPPEEEELSKSVVTQRLTALFKKGAISDYDLAFWDANKKLGFKVLPETIQKAVLEYKE